MLGESWECDAELRGICRANVCSVRPRRGLKVALGSQIEGRDMRLAYRPGQLPMQLCQEGYDSTIGCKGSDR
jgi:hypothetical protein